MVAAEQGHGDIASLLLQQQSIRVGDTGQKGQTPFLVAAASGSMSCVNIFTGDIRVNINHVDRSGRSALLLAAEEGMEKVVKAPLSAKRMDAHSTDKDGRNALSYAAAKGQLLIVRYLVRSNLSIAQRDKNGQNAISWASNSAKSIARNHAGASTLGCLIKQDGGAASVPDNDGLTSLAWAMDRPRYLDAVKALIEVGGVRVDQQDRSRGRPVLSWAATEGYVEIGEYLLTVQGIEENLRDNDGRTPLSYATSNGRLDVVKILSRLDVRLPDSSGRTPRDWAILNGQEEVVQELKILERASLH